MAQSPRFFGRAAVVRRRGLHERLRKFLLLEVVIGDYPDFGGYADQVTLRFFRIACFIGLTIAFLETFLSRIAAQVTPADLRVMDETRVVIVIWSLCGLGIVGWREPQPRTRVNLLLAMLVVAFSLAYGSISRNGTLEEPWSWSLLGNLSVTALLMIPLRKRVPYCLALGVASAVATVVGNPGNLNYPYLPLYFQMVMLFSLLAMTVGAKYTSIARQNHQAAWEAIRAKEELDLQRLHALAFAEEKTNEAAQAVFERQFARQEERRRIAHDLHDELGHGIVRLNLDMEDFVESEGASERVRRRVSGFREMLDEVYGGVHRVVRALRDESLPRGQLKPMIEQTIRQSLARTAIEPVVLIEPDEAKVNDELYSVAFRILQECLNNTLKYAHASHIEVAVSVASGRFVFFYYDNGGGFDSGQSRRGFGLSGMEERTKNLRGTMAVSSAPGKGVEITIEIPMEIAS